MPPVELIALLVVLAVATALIRSRRVRVWLKLGREPADDNLPYQARTFLLTKGEAAFYHAICRAVAGRYVVSMKVRLLDVLTCPREAWQRGHGGRIAQKHLDFVLCDLSTTEILVAIELDDRSHARRDRSARDVFLDAAVKAAGVPLLRFSASARYDPDAIARRIGQVLSTQLGASIDGTASGSYTTGDL